MGVRPGRRARLPDIPSRCRWQATTRPNFVEKYGSAAVREVSEVFEVSHAEATAALDRLVAAGSLDLPEPGLLYRAPLSIACDTVTGQCW